MEYKDDATEDVSSKDIIDGVVENIGSTTVTGLSSLCADTEEEEQEALFLSCNSRTLSSSNQVGSLYE